MKKMLAVQWEFFFLSPTHHRNVNNFPHTILSVSDGEKVFLQLFFFSVSLTAMNIF
jgi:hypothetical protein